MRMYHRLHRLAALSLILGVLMLTSCTSTPAPSPTSGTSATATKPYGDVTIVTNFGTGHVDPFFDVTTSYTAIGSAVLDSFVYRDVDNYEVKPGIAERWEISPDGLTHTFYIRKGVKFHDGSDLTGADAKFSIERLLAPGSMQNRAANWRPTIASVELKDDYTVALHLNTPQFEPLIGWDSAMTAVMPKKYIEEKGVDYFGRHVVGSGPWKVVKFEPGVRLELEAVDSHWRTVPKFKNLTILNIPEMASRVAMLKTGELDMAVVSTDSVPGLEAAGLHIFTYRAGGGFAGMPLYDAENPEKYAFGDVRVRKALQLAINSKEIADNLFGGHGGPVSHASNYVDSDSVAKANAYDPNLLRPDPYDPEGAKKLLAEAGHPNGFATKIDDVGGGGLRSIVSLALAGYWRKIGVNAEILPLDYGAFFPKMRARSPDVRNSFYLYANPGTAQWDTMIGWYHSKKSTSGNTNNPKLDWLLDNIPSTKDPVERGKMKLEAAVLARNAYTHISVLEADNVLALSKKVGSVGPLRYTFEFSGIMYETITHAK